MPEQYVWLLYGVCFTLGGAMAVASTVGKWYEYKPWNCVYCMTVWMGAVATALFAHDFSLVGIIGFWAACHVLAYIVYNKMS